MGVMALDPFCHQDCCGFGLELCDVSGTLNPEASLLLAADYGGPGCGEGVLYRVWGPGDLETWAWGCRKAAA